MKIRYKYQASVILALNLGMRSAGWNGVLDGLRMFAVSGWGGQL